MDKNPHSNAKLNYDYRLASNKTSDSECHRIHCAKKEAERTLPKHTHSVYILGGALISE